MNFEASLVSPGWSIYRAMEQIDINQQGIALVVDDERRLLATVTDGDIRRAILRGVGLNSTIQELLDQQPEDKRKAPVTAPHGTEQAELVRIMTDNSVRQLPIADESGHIVDLVGLTDLIQDYELPMTAVVMAGGLGSRLKPLTDDIPKPMLPLGDKPLLEVTVERLRQAGIRRLRLTTLHKREVISEHFGDGQDFGVAIEYVEENQPLGTAGALSLLADSDEPLLVINGDILTEVNYAAMLDFHNEHQAEMTVGVRENEIQVPYGVIEADGIEVSTISEKPVLRHLVNAGVYLLNPEVCRLIPNDQFYDMPDLITLLISQGRRVICFPIREYWVDIGQIADYEKAKRDYNARDSKK